MSYQHGRIGKKKMNDAKLFYEIENETLDFKNLKPEIYQPKYLEILKTISPYPKLSSFLQEPIDTGDSFLDQSQKTNHIYLKSTNVKPYEVEFSTITYLNEETVKDKKPKLLENGDILISRVGKWFGNVALYHSNKKCSFSDNVLRMKVDKLKIDPAYLVAFLNSKYGRLQIERAGKGSGQDVINTTTIGSIYVIIPSEEQGGIKYQEILAKSVFDSRKTVKTKNDESMKIYEGIDSFIENELGLKFPKSNNEIVYQIEPEELKQKRYDPLYYHPHHKKIKNYLKNHNSMPLIKMCDFPNRNKSKPFEPDEKFLYVEIKNIDRFNGKIKSYSKKLGKNKPDRAKNVIKTDDILFSLTRPTRNAIVIVPDNLNNQICTSGFAVLDNPVINTEYLFAILRSNLIKLQVHYRTRSSMYPVILPDDLKQVLIPEPSKGKKTLGKKVIDILHKAEIFTNEAEILEKKYKKDFEDKLEDLLAKIL